MKQAALVENGIVTNVILVDKEIPAGYIVVDYPAVIGLSLDQARLNHLDGEARKHRKILLSESDWRALSDNTLSAEWATYRQALRDITEQPNYPENISWPIVPQVEAGTLTIQEAE